MVLIRYDMNRSVLQGRVMGSLSWWSQCVDTSFLKRLGISVHMFGFMIGGFLFLLGLIYQWHIVSLPFDVTVIALPLMAWCLPRIDQENMVFALLGLGGMLTWMHLIVEHRIYVSGLLILGLLYRLIRFINAQDVALPWLMFYAICADIHSYQRLPMLGVSYLLMIIADGQVKPTFRCQIPLMLYIGIISVICAK